MQVLLILRNWCLTLLVQQFATTLKFFVRLTSIFSNEFEITSFLRFKSVTYKSDETDRQTTLMATCKVNIVTHNHTQCREDPQTSPPPRFRCNILINAKDIVELQNDSTLICVKRECGACIAKWDYYFLWHKHFILEERSERLPSQMPFVCQLW